VELLFVTVISAGIGGILRYSLPGRASYGAVLLPALAVAVTAGTWVSMLWLGARFDGGWIWAVSLLTGTLAAVAAALYLPRRRVNEDERFAATLSGGQA